MKKKLEIHTAIGLTIVSVILAFLNYPFYLVALFVLFALTMWDKNKGLKIISKAISNWRNNEK